MDALGNHGDLGRAVVPDRAEVVSLELTHLRGGCAGGAPLQRCVACPFRGPASAAEVRLPRFTAGAKALSVRRGFDGRLKASSTHLWYGVSQKMLESLNTPASPPSPPAT